MGVRRMVWDWAWPSRTEVVLADLRRGVGPGPLSCSGAVDFGTEQLVDVQLFCSRSATFFQREDILVQAFSAS